MNSDLENEWPREVTRVPGTEYVIASNLQGMPALYQGNKGATEWMWVRDLDELVPESYHIQTRE